MVLLSPIHPDSHPVPIEIEPGLHVHRCPISGGIWISVQAYFAWRESQPPASPAPLTSGLDPEPGPGPVAPASPAEEPQAVDDRGRSALLCPESGRLMMRYRVGQGLRFQLDRSPV